jgi:hypothetical protein
MTRGHVKTLYVHTACASAESIRYIHAWPVWLSVEQTHSTFNIGHFLMIPATRNDSDVRAVIFMHT